MSLREFVEYLAREWAVIRSAPMTFIVAIALILSASWWFMGQLYSARFEGQREAILALEGRLKAKDDDLTRKSAQIFDLEKKASVATVQAALRDPNGMYQGYAKVGIVHGAIHDLGNGIVNFALIDANGDFNKLSDFEYQDLTLRIERFSSAASIDGMGIINNQRFRQVVCRIVDHRK